MWNDFDTMSYNGMTAETLRMKGFAGDEIGAYYSRPLTEGNHPGLVLIPHMPGWDEYCREAARRFTEHGYSVLCPDIYSRFGHGTPSEVSARALSEGGARDETVMGDTLAALEFLRRQPDSNGSLGVIGMCSGGRHTFLAACTLPGIDAAADCWGGGVVADPEDATPARPHAPIEYAENLSCPLIGIFGNDDADPSPHDVDILEEALRKYGKDYTFYRYEGAGHGIWYYHRPMYRQSQAMDSFNKVLEFFDLYLKGTVT